MAKIVWKPKAIQKLIFDEGQKKIIARGFNMANEIKRSMSVKGTGREYIKAAKGNKGEGVTRIKSIVHIASAPGFPPATDTGRLRASISVNWTGSGMSRGEFNPVPESEPDDSVGNPGGSILNMFGGKFKVVVGTNVGYSGFLEFGTSKMEKRPFLRPVFDRLGGKPAPNIKFVVED
jgi:HK97 gp10 family phage protein